MNIQRRIFSFNCRKKYHCSSHPFIDASWFMHQIYSWVKHIKRRLTIFTLWVFCLGKVSPFYKTSQFFCKAQGFSLVVILFYFLIFWLLHTASFSCWVLKDLAWLLPLFFLSWTLIGHLLWTVFRPCRRYKDE